MKYVDAEPMRIPSYRLQSLSAELPETNFSTVIRGDLQLVLERRG